MGSLLCEAFLDAGMNTTYLEYQSTTISTQLHLSLVGKPMMKSIQAFSQSFLIGERL